MAADVEQEVGHRVGSYRLNVMRFGGKIDFYCLQTYPQSITEGSLGEHFYR